MASSRNSRDFETFKREFTKWQTKFGLQGYKVYFKYEPCGDNYATIETKQKDMVATVFLNPDTSKEDERLRDVREVAKHEAIHLLTHRLENLAYSRFLDDSEIVEASEDLVRRLEGLIT